MFCPKCATQNLDGASFCRTCGANISLVPQALTGQIANAPEEDVDHRRRRRRNSKEVTLDQAFKNAFMGIAFLLIAIVLSRLAMGQTWWFWMLLPAFSMMGTGIVRVGAADVLLRPFCMYRPMHSTCIACAQHSKPTVGYSLYKK